MRRLLMIAYMFPPATGVGIERTLKHVTYLPESGWQPVVVAAENPGYRLVDPGTLGRVPAGTEVHRARSIEPAHLRRAVAGLLRPRRPAAAPSAASAVGLRPRGGVRGLLEGSWRRYVELTFVPDEQIGWAPAAIVTALAADAAEPVHAIYSSGPPWTCHLVAAAVQALTGLPWVADFRDPWVGHAYAAPLPAPHRAVNSRLERMVVHRAAASVFASAGVRDEFVRSYPSLADRFVTIHNGYDLDDVAAATAAARPAEDGRFRLAFTGSLQGEAEARLLVAGLEQALSDHPDLRERLRVQLVGWLSPAAEAIAGEALARLAPAVERTNQQPKAVALRLLREADAALVLLADEPGRASVPSAKLFDALGLDRPVLAVAPDGEVRRILAELGWGLGVDPTPSAFSEGLVRLMGQPIPDRPADPERRYERRALSRRLATLLDGVAGRVPTRA